ncbi:MAG TPA: hypothetical protein PKK06_09080 [Phycisphaerae bacterium]|nr:hypothetical protein [Phycisphaerae bacterium]HNU45276.1 hypothetical protein [Phycisphaerae bacterium]
MDKRTKALATVFAVLVGGMVLYAGVYPRWIKPLLEIDKRIAERLEVLDALETKAAQVELAGRQYRTYVARVGSMDAGKVENNLRARLFGLIEKHRLAQATVSKGRVSADKKIGWQQLTVSVSATDQLERIVEFVEDLSELPDVMQLGSLTLSPVSSTRRAKQRNEVKIDMALTVLVLPQQKLAGERFADAGLKQPETHVRHASLDYSTIWRADPFSEYEERKPPPPRPTVVAETEPKPVEPPPPVDNRWQDRAQWQVCVTLLGGDGGTPLDELMMVNTRNQQRRYAAVGEDVDGGKLLFVHQRGALVNRQDGDWVYPLGARLDQAVRLAEAVEYPELRRARERLPMLDIPVGPPDLEPVGRAGTSGAPAPRSIIGSRLRAGRSAAMSAGTGIPYGPPDPPEVPPVFEAAVAPTTPAAPPVEGEGETEVELPPPD